MKTWNPMPCKVAALNRVFKPTLAHSIITSAVTGNTSLWKYFRVISTLSALLSSSLCYLSCRCGDSKKWFFFWNERCKDEKQSRLVFFFGEEKEESANSVSGWKLDFQANVYWRTLVKDVKQTCNMLTHMYM